MDRDSIKEFLEKRGKEMEDKSFLPPVQPKVEQSGISKKKRLRLKPLLVALVLILLGVLFMYIGVSVYKKVMISSYDDHDKILESVSRLTEVDNTETPKIVTVTNTELIKGQVFFKEALTGDKLLIFETSKKAILYRPSTNKIISIAPLN